MPNSPKTNLSERTKKLVLTAILFAVALVLSVVEGFFPPIGIPGVKLGLSNIAVMYALFFVGKKSAFAIAVLKALFVAMTRGPISGILSLSGGMCSLLAMILFLWLFKERISYLILSIIGAIMHNLGQYAAISLLYTTLNLWVYLPALALSGILAGLGTAALLKAILPVIGTLK